MNINRRKIYEPLPEPVKPKEEKKQEKKPVFEPVGADSDGEKRF